MIKTGKPNRKKTGWVLLAAGVLSLPVIVALAPEATVSQALAQSSDALKRLADRSPGTRGDTAPLKGKDGGKGKGGGLAIGEKVTPEQRALGKVFEKPPEEDVNQLVQTPPVAQVASTAAAPIQDISRTIPPPPAGGSSGGFFIPVGGSSSSGGSTGGISSSGGSTGGDTSTSGGSTTGGDTSTSSGGDTSTSSGGSTSGGVTPPVPEPGTWMMMILGFGLIGGMMRRGRKATKGLVRA